MNTPRKKRPLRILLVSNHRRFKINFRAHPWASELAARGHEVDVMCHANTERWRTKIEKVDGFRIIENPDLLIGALRQGWDPVCAYRRLRFLRRENKKYDLIHCLDTRLAVVWPALTY
ncbi:MAG TPA: glycosyltransferase, partial [Candidatus Hydrogenedentes bacterium]|nr:glycosyltransferase [Candidatus Hydrogenedentota bacterium]